MNFCFQTQSFKIKGIIGKRCVLSISHVRLLEIRPKYGSRCSNSLHKHATNFHVQFVHLHTTALLILRCQTTRSSHLFRNQGDINAK